MSFLSLWSLLFALSLPVVVTFYLLKRKRVVRLVPSTVLWQRFLAENQASAPFQRLRNHWLMWLQLLLLLLLVLALARPYFSGRLGQGALQIVVLDASASMQATDESPSRFERARREALTLVDGLKTGFGASSQQMLVMIAGANAEVRQSATSEKAALRRAIESAQVTDSPTRLAEALRVAATLTKDRADAEVHLFSDGAGVDLTEFERVDLPLVFHRVGQRNNNLGIVSLDVKANPENPAQRAVFASVNNFSGVPVESLLELRLDGELVETKSISAGPTNTTPVVFLANQSQDGVFTVRLTQSDDLLADNEASVVSLLPEPVRVLLVSRGNRFLEKAIVAAGPNIEVVTVPDYTAASPAAAVVVLDDVAPTEWPGANLLAIHVANTNWFEGGIGTLEAPPIVDWKNTHSLLRFVNFDTVQIAEAMEVRTPTWAVSLVDSPAAPLVIAGELGRQRIVWVGFDTLQSTWPLRISFPIFIANSIEWLNPASAAAERLTLRSGDPFRLPLAESLVPEGTVLSARVKMPGGAERTIPLDSNARELVFGETATRGRYELTLGTNQMVFVANLLDAQESNLRPSEELSLGRRGTVVATPLQRANLEYWRWFALAGLVVMMGEWWWFHRRTA